MQLDAPVVTKAFLTHDMATLNEFCGPEIMQRLEGLCKAFQQQVRRQTGSTLLSGGQAPALRCCLPLTCANFLLSFPSRCLRPDLFPRCLHPVACRAGAARGPHHPVCG